LILPTSTRALVFKREKFLTAYEIENLSKKEQSHEEQQSQEKEQDKWPVQQEIEYPDCPY
jgi:hypothetical protein